MKQRTTHQKFKEKALKNPGVSDKYKKLEDEFMLIEEFIRARKNSGKTQLEIAIKMKTTQSVVARIESSLNNKKHSPTISTLKRYADALGYHLLVKLEKGARS